MTDLQNKVISFIIKNPFKDSQFKTKKNWRLDIAKRYGTSEQNIKSIWYRYRKRNNLVVTKTVTNSKGQTTTTESLRNTEAPDLTGLTIKSATQLAYGAWNTKYEREDGLTIDEIEDSFSSVVKKYKDSKVKNFKYKKIKEKKALRVITSDEHIGMNPNVENSIFNYTYGVEEYKKTLNKVFDSAMQEYEINGRFEVLFLDNLGDRQDGQNKKTVRGTHELDQNLTNQEMFEVSIDNKIKLIDSFVKAKIANKIIVREIVNDNHSGDFGAYASMAIKKICQLMYHKNNVDVDILQKFFEHRFYGEHCHVLTHGKDKRYRMRGMPLHLDPNIKDFINGYLDHHKISSKYIHIDKGDLHQLSYDKCKRFDYRNFGSLAPPSPHIQHNYSDGYSCYSTQVISPSSPEVKHTDYFLNYENQ